MPRNTQRATNLLAGVTDELLGADFGTRLQDNAIRVEKLLLELVRPHPVQPRRVLPERIHHAFHGNQLTPSQALRELIQIVQVASRQRSRPFTNVLDLLTQPEDESETPSDLSPEETLLRDLVNLAVTIRDDGQVNPLTVVDATQGVTRLYRIETGERRYWATWLLRDFIPEAGHDGMIPCIVIPGERASVFRQAKENTSRTGLTAIAMARQVALLLLAVHDNEIPDSPVNNDFYRQALDLDLLGKREYTDMVLSAMGGIGRMHLSRYKALLKLSDEAMEMADRHSIDEKKLRYVAAMPTETHAELVRQIITLKLTSKQIQDICESGDRSDGNDDSHPEQIPAKAMKVARILKSISTTLPKDVARALLRQESDLNLARARIQSMHRLLNDAEQFLSEE
ncbi:MAG: ParB/RepB/Spo0J family partition protein [Aggregatilineales bacterium]